MDLGYAEEDIRKLISTNAQIDWFGLLTLFFRNKVKIIPDKTMAAKDYLQGLLAQQNKESNSMIDKLKVAMETLMPCKVFNIWP